MDVLTAIGSIMGGGDWITIVLKLVLGLGVGIAFFFLMRWINKQAQIAAENKSNQGRAQDQGDITNQNQVISQDGTQSQNDIENVIKNPPQPPTKPS